LPSYLDRINWIPVKNTTITNGIVRDIGKQTFTTLCYLMIQCHEDNYVITTMKSVQQYLGYKENRTIKKIFKCLEDNQFIRYEDDTGIDIYKYGYTNNIKIFVDYKQNALDELGYEMIPIDLFTKYYEIIGDSGWALLCSLAILNNFKDQCAYPSFEYLCSGLRLSATTLKESIDVLCKNKLISIKDKDDTIYSYEDSNGNIFYKYSRNKYYVRYIYEDPLWVNYRNSLQSSKSN